MGTERHVTIGLARARVDWFSAVASWATSGVLGIDFVKTVSPDELRDRLQSGRVFSAAIIDGDLLGVDRDLIATAVERGCAVIVIADDDRRDWIGIGASVVLAPTFGPADLEATLERHARPIGRLDDVPGRVTPLPEEVGHRARTIAVTGAGGTGRSTVAVAIAQGLAASIEHRDSVLLADLALHADQALIHDVGDVVPGVQELVEAHRAGTPSPADIRAMTFAIAARRYDLLLGLRRHRDWTVLRPRALRAAIDGLRRAYTAVVADVDADLESEHDTGSADVEDRNRLASTLVEVADLVVVVGRPGVTGMHGLLRTTRAWTGAGVDPERIVPVLSRTGRGRRSRRDAVEAWTSLARESTGATLLGPVFVPEHRGLETAIHDGAPLPTAFVRPIAETVARRLESVHHRPAGDIDEAPMAIVPGSLGTWDDEVAG